jgi:tetratricopeptide (TPR) repeat protein
MSLAEKTNLKIAVYTCSLNEEKFVERWVASAQDANQLLVLDTGSTDDTVPLLKRFDVDVHHATIKPWRFDDAKNAALCLLRPDIDVAVQLDMDEVLTPDWRGAIETAWKPDTTRLKYLYVWNWLSDGHPDRTFYSDKIAGRYTHRWRNAVHEVLVPTVPETISICDELLIAHHADPDKPRDGYLDLLQLSVREDPFNDRNSHYYGRELYFRERYQDAVLEFRRHLSLPTALWLPERAASLRYMGKCNESLKDNSAAYNCYMLATLEDPQSREAYVDLASFLLRQQEWCGVVHFSMKASNLPADHTTYIAERYAREEGPYDLTAVALFNLGQKQVALDFAKKALAFNPRDPRLQENVRVMS